MDQQKIDAANEIITLWYILGGLITLSISTGIYLMWTAKPVEDGDVR